VALGAPLGRVVDIDSLLSGWIEAMAVPKRRQSNSRTGKRRSHHHKKPKQLTFCPKCSASIPTHVVCPQCGYYMGRVVVESAEE
jgi:large subunit ribosomal protein L32